MADQTPLPPESVSSSSRVRPWFRRGLTASLITGLLLALTHSWWLPRVATGLLPLLAQRFAGVELELEVLALSSTSCELRGVRAREVGQAPVLEDFAASSLWLEFSLRDLLAGELSGLRSVRGEGLQLDLHLERLEGESSADEPAATFELPAKLPLIELTTRRVSLSFPGEVRVLAQGARLSCDDQGALRIAEFSVEDSSQASVWRTRPLSLTAEYSAEALQGVELFVDGTRLVRPSSFDLSRVSEGALQLELALDLGTQDSALVADLDAGGATFQLAINAAELSSLASRSPIELSLPLHGRCDLELSGQLQWQDLATLKAEANFELTRFEGAGRKLDKCAGQATLEGGWLEVPNMELLQAENHLRLSSLRLPLFATESQAWLREISGFVELQVEDLAAITGQLPLPERYKSLPAHRLALQAELSNGRAKVSEGSFESAGGHITLTHVELSAGERWSSPWTLEARGQADVEHLDQVGLLLGQNDWWGRLEGQLDVHGTWPKLVGEWTLNGRNLRFGELEVGALALELEADGERVHLEQLLASGRGLQLEGSATYDLNAARLDEGHLSLEVPALEKLPGALFESGAAKLEADFSGPLQELAASATLETQGLKLQGISISDARATLSSLGKQLRCDELHASSDFGTLDAAFELAFDASWALTTARLASFSLVRDEQGLRLSRPSSLLLTSAADGLTANLEPLELRGEAGVLQLSGSFTPTELALDLDVQELHPNTFLAGTQAALPKLARLDATAHIEGPWHSPHFESKGSLEELYLPRATEACDVTWALSSDRELLAIEELLVVGRDALRLRVTGSLPFEALLRDELPGAASSALSLKTEASLPLAELAALAGRPDLAELRGLLELHGDFSGSLDELSGAMTVAAQGLRLPAEQQPPEVGDGSLHGVIRLDRGLHVQGLQVKLGELVDLRVQAAIEGSTSLRTWVHATSKALSSAQVDAQVEIGALDLATLARGFGAIAPELERLRQGTLSGELRVRGALEAPELEGALKLADGRVRLGSGLPTADRLQAVVSLHEASFQIENLTGELGGAPFELSGSALLAGLESELDFRLTGEDLLLFRNREAKLRANADLKVNGPYSAMRVSGTLELSDGRYAPTTDFLDLRGGSKARGARGFQLFHLREAPLDSLQFDIELSSAAPFVLRNTVIAGSMRPQLHLGGTGLLPLLTGTVYLDRTLMRLPSSSLELTGGTISFTEDAPFHPDVELNGRTRLMGYDIKASISGAYDAPEIMLSSTPPLSQENLLLLLLTGRLPEDPDQTDPLATANTVALYLAKDTLARWFADDGPMDEDSLFNRFEFSGGRDVSKNGVETINIAYRLTRKEGLAPEARDRRHVYLVGERDRFEDYNYGLKLVFRLR